MFDKKVVIYQVLPRLFGNKNTTRKAHGTIQENGSGKFSDFTPKALNAIADMGFTHIWYTGIIEHATQTSYKTYNIAEDFPEIVKGKAGSPYAIKDYYDVDPDLADNVEKRMQEFQELIERTHASGLKVIIDFVPNHLARNYVSDVKPVGVEDFGVKDNNTVSFDRNNNFYYLPQQSLDLSQITNKSTYKESPAKVTGNNCFTNVPSKNDWYETVKLNYGIDFTYKEKKYFHPVPDTWLKMLDIILYWSAKGVDGFRCDMAEMVPVEFWSWLILLAKEQYPELLFIAEVYQPALYEEYVNKGRFDYLYDKVDFYDTIKELAKGSLLVHTITSAWQRISPSIRDKMLYFLENHDEVRLASDYGLSNPFKVIPALHVSLWLNTCPFMMYFGQELGEAGNDAEGFSGKDGHTTIFDYWSLDKMIRWNNEGKFDEQQLTSEEKQLRQEYIKVLKFTNKEKAIVSGQFYDLMYANPSAQAYIFMRGSENEILVVMSNFNAYPVQIKLNIPEEAYKFFKTTSTANKQLFIFDDDLIDSTLFTLSQEITVNPYNSKIVKFIL